jgi:hypothetical protein
MNNTELLKLLDQLKATMISVATGGPRIGEVQDDFAHTFDEVNAELLARGINNPVPYRDLWEWYGRWSSGDLPSYQSRRSFVASLFSPLTQRVQTGHAVEFEPTGWNRVDRTVTELRSRLASARDEEHFQAVGLLCRETLISTAQAVFDPEVHPTLDGIAASPTDAKRMLDAYIGASLGGGRNEYVRRHVKAALDLAVHLQHKRTATYQDSAICAEATTSVVNIIATMAGVRESA